MTGVWLRLTCTLPCSKVRLYAVELVARRSSQRITLAQALARMRCRVCGGRPAGVVASDAGAETVSTSATWTVVLL